MVYLFSSFEKGNLEEFRQGSEYEFAKLSQGTTAYKDIGDKNDPAIIVIHGATLPSEGFIGFCSGLSAKGYRVICYDQYGRGYSDRPIAKYDMQLYIEQLRELLDFLNIKEAILYGSSMGAPIAINFSNKYKERILAIGLQVPLVHSNSKVLDLIKVPVVGNLFLRTFGKLMIIPLILSTLFILPHWLACEETLKRRLVTFPLVLLQLYPQYRSLRVLW